MTHKISKTSNVSSGTTSCNIIHENIHSNHTIHSFDINGNDIDDNFDSRDNGSFLPQQISDNHSFIHNKNTNYENTETRLQIPLQDTVHSNTTSDRYTQVKNQVERGCTDISLEIDFDIF